MKCLVLLSGCGLGDGSAIEEAVLMYLALDKLGLEYLSAAENKDIISMNHLTERPGESRNILVESARLGRGRIQDLAAVSVDDFDALLIPGGLGVRHFRDSQAAEQLVQAFHSQGKPIGAVCAVIDLLRKWLNPNLLAEETKALPAHAYCHDPVNLVYYSPAFRAGGNLADIYQGTLGMITAMAGAIIGHKGS